jgi:spermidine synthase
VFPHVALWRGDFYANRPIVALVASARAMTLDSEQLRRSVRLVVPEASDEAILTGVLPFYAGNLGLARAVLGDGSINTDEYPLIEYLSPRTQWAESGESPWLVSLPLVRFLEQVQSAAPVDADPYLAQLSAAERGYVKAGASYYRAIVHRLREENEAAEENLADALQRLPPSLQVGGPFLAADGLVR